MRTEKFESSPEKTLHISSLQSGGLITNYYCSSRCRHCLYASSPGRKKDYIREDTAAQLFGKIKSLGCLSLHIGGGEPFLDINGLQQVLIAAQKEQMYIEYVETNSSWFKDHNSSCRVLEQLQKFSLSRLLISMSPFHNEFIPFYKVKGIIAACNQVGISVFPWVSDFFAEIDSFADDEPHPLHQYLDTFGPGYLKTVFQRYWIHPGGRALTGFLPLYREKPVEELVQEGPGNTGCIELTDTSHFHFDLYENYIPGLCSGIRIHYQDMGKPLSQQQYPFLQVLYTQGPRGLYQIAREEFGFMPREKYASKCHLCLDIRHYLVQVKGMEIKEFGPQDFYREIGEINLLKIA